jgi:hypothetical protein
MARLTCRGRLRLDNFEGGIYAELLTNITLSLTESTSQSCQKLAPFDHSEEHRYLRIQELNQKKVQSKVDGRHTSALVNVVSFDEKCRPQMQALTRWKSTLTAERLRSEYANFMA